MPDLPLTGGCMCGGVRYAVDAPLRLAGYCHCTRCQRRTGGGAAVSGWVEPGSVRIVEGADLVRTWQPPDGFGKSFCATCGSALWSAHPDTGEPFAVRLGTLDADPGIRPSYHQFVDFAVPWEPLPDDGLERHGGARPR